MKVWKNSEKEKVSLIYWFLEGSKNTYSGKASLFYFRSHECGDYPRSYTSKAGNNPGQDTSPLQGTLNIHTYRQFGNTTMTLGEHANSTPGLGGAETQQC